MWYNVGVRKRGKNYVFTGDWGDIPLEENKEGV